MQRIRIAVLIALATIALSSCDVIDPPEKGARDWLTAFSNLDGNRISELTCTAQQSNIQQAGMWASLISILGQSIIGQQGKADISGLTYTTLRRNGETAFVRVTGPVRVSILAYSQSVNVDETWRMAREAGKWKWCGK